MLEDVNTIAIPIDAIFLVSLLIVFVLLGYFFNNILRNDTNHFAQKINDDSNLEVVKEKLEDQLALEATTLDQKKVEKQRIKKLNFLPSSKLLGLGSLAVVAMGGVNLLGLQNMQKYYEGVSTSRANINLENQSTRSNLSVVYLKPFDKTQMNIKKISYIDPLLSTFKSSKDNYDYQVKQKQSENNFSF